MKRGFVISHLEFSLHLLFFSPEEIESFCVRLNYVDAVLL